MISKYLVPTNNLAFVKVFGNEKHKRITIDFLNSVLNLTGYHQIVDLEFLSMDQPSEIAFRQESLVDVLVRDQSGNKFIVEMKVAKFKWFEKRAQFYAAKAYCAHFGEGKKYNDVTKVIFVAITNYIAFPTKDHYKSDNVILDNPIYNHLLKDFSFTYIELPKFTKTNDQLCTVEEKWYYFLKHADKSNEISEVLYQHPEIIEAYDLLFYFNWTELELNHYDKSFMNEADLQGMIDAAVKESDEEKKERKARDKQKCIEIAKTFFIANFTSEEIADIVDLSIEEIENIKSISLDASD